MKSCKVLNCDLSSKTSVETYDTETDSNEAEFSELKSIRAKNVNRLIIAHLNINSIRNKFDLLASNVSGNIDILMLSETKLDESFPTEQFRLKDFAKPFRLDRSCNGGGILLYVREDIPCKFIKLPEFSEKLECFFVEINLRKKKWLLCCSYNPHKSFIVKHLNNLGNVLDRYLPTYDNLLIVGDFNSEVSESAMNEFCKTYNLGNLVKGPTCFKNPTNPSSIDLILTNRPRSFQGTVLIETGLSDFHKMTLTVLKMHFKKQSPKIVHYRDYNNFKHDDFRNDLIETLQTFDVEYVDYNIFNSSFLKVLNRHAPQKQRYVRSNQSKFMDRELNKAVMKRSRLRNKFIKDKTQVSKEAYTKQRNLCTSMVRKKKRIYFSNLNTRDLTDNRSFWKTVKPLFSDKSSGDGKLVLIEGDDILSEDTKVANALNEYFNKVVENLGIENNDNIEQSTDGISDPILKAIKKYEKHPSITRIKSKVKVEPFSFKHITPELFETELQKLNAKKSVQPSDIPTKIAKANSDIIALYLSRDFNNNCVDAGIFPSALKFADIVPVHKKDNKTDKSNYRPVSILPSLSKIYERCIYQQMYQQVDKLLSKFQCGFRKGFSTQHSLLVMIEKWRETLDNGGACGALLTDLSKAFDCLKHDLLIAKLNAYGFTYESLKLINNYLSERKHRTKVGSSFSEWLELNLGVPQGSILGPLLFNIYMCDLFFFIEELPVTSYADDTTPYACENNSLVVLSKLKASEKLYQWFSINYLKCNASKSHLLLTSPNTISTNIAGDNIISSKQEKLLGITIDSALTFNNHVSIICDKVSHKLHAMARLSNFMSQSQLKVVMKAFLVSQFGYCPLVWMNHSRTLNNRINRLHERALRLIYKDPSLTFEQLLLKDNSVRIHHKNLQILVTEMYKVKHNLAPAIMHDVFQESSNPYNTRQGGDSFKTRNVKTVHYGTETLAHLGPRIWQQVPNEIKQITELKEFKRIIKTWIPKKCPCRLCKIYIRNIGFI